MQELTAFINSRKKTKSKTRKVTAEYGLLDKPRAAKVGSMKVPKVSKNNLGKTVSNKT